MAHKIPHRILSTFLGFLTLILVNCVVLMDSSPGADIYQRIVMPLRLKKRLLLREAKRRHKKALHAPNAA